MNFAGAHILSIEQFERPDIERVFRVADRMEPYAQRRKITKVLDGAILGSMFFEPSTRTRTTFELAAKRLSADIISIAEAPSDICEDCPAVTVPCGLKEGFNAARSASVVSGRIVSSAATDISAPLASCPSMAMISRLNLPSTVAW